MKNNPVLPTRLLATATVLLATATVLLATAAFAPLTLHAESGAAARPEDKGDATPAAVTAVDTDSTAKSWWYASDNLATGTKVVATGDTLDVTIALADRRPEDISGSSWDGISLTKEGEGTLTLSAQNIYTGTTTVNGGILKIISGGVIGGGNGAIAVSAENSSDATLSNENGEWNIAGDLVVGSLGTDHGTPILDKTSVGTLAITGAQGSVEVSGTAYLGRWANGKAIITVADNGRFEASSVILGHQGGEFDLNIAQNSTFASTGDMTIANELAGSDIRSSGVVTVAGRMSATNNLVLANLGQATLTIESTGSVEAVGIVLGTGKGASAEVHVSGQLSASNSLSAGVDEATTLLAIAAGGSVNVPDGAYTQNSTATLAITIKNDFTTIPLSAKSAVLGGTLTVTTSGNVPFAGSKASQLADSEYRRTLIHTTGGIDSNFATENIPSDIDGRDFIVSQLFKSTNDYALGYQLAWNTTSSRKWGTFTLDADASFEVDTALANVGPSERGWDGNSLTKEGAGTLTLSAQNTYTGATTVNEGTLVIGAANNLGGGGNIMITNTHGNFTVDTNTHWTLVNAVSGTGTFEKKGSGALKVETTTAATVVVTDGTLVAVANNAVRNETAERGSVSVGADGTLELGPLQSVVTDTATISGTVRFALPGALTGAAPFAAGSFTLTDTAVLILTLDGYTPVNGASFNLFDGLAGDAVAFSGDFETITLPELAGDLSWDTSQLDRTGVVSIIPEPGTYGPLAGAALLALGLLRRRKQRG